MQHYKAIDRPSLLDSDFKPQRSERRNRNRKNKHTLLRRVNVGRVAKGELFESATHWSDVL